VKAHPPTFAGSDTLALSGATWSASPTAQVSASRRSGRNLVYVYDAGHLHCLTVADGETVEVDVPAGLRGAILRRHFGLTTST
jgi:outer membrane protein assembly factor BamB